MRSALRAAFQPYIENGRPSADGARSRSPRVSGGPVERSLYSQLSDDEKARFQGLGEHGDGAADQRRPDQELGGSGKALSRTVTADPAGGAPTRPDPRGEVEGSPQARLRIP